MEEEGLRLSFILHTAYLLGAGTCIDGGEWPGLVCEP